MRAIQDNDEAKIEEAILRLSESRRVFAPLAFAVGAFVMLFNGLRLLVTNWRLTLVQILPAMWIWLAMLDLKAHVLHGKSFTVVRGPVLIPLGLVIIAITVASFFLNAVFAFAVSQPGRPEVRPAVAQARQHLKTIMASGAVVGALLAFSTIVVTRWGRPWFTISLGIVVGVMMVSYVAVPARLIGAKPPKQSRRDKLASTAVGGALSMTVCTPPYLLGRLGILALGSSAVLVFILGIFARRARSHPASRRHRCGQGDQDERHPHRSAPSQRPRQRANPDDKAARLVVAGVGCRAARARQPQVDPLPQTPARAAWTVPALQLNEPKNRAKLAHYRESLEMLRRAAGELAVVDLLDAELKRLTPTVTTRRRVRARKTSGRNNA